MSSNQQIPPIRARTASKISANTTELPIHSNAKAAIRIRKT